MPQCCGNKWCVENNILKKGVCWRCEKVLCMGLVGDCGRVGGEVNNKWAILSLENEWEKCREELMEWLMKGLKF